MAAWAFTAAISSDEIDIGVETRSDYQYSGLGTIVAEKMIQYCLQQHKRPVWACHSNNMASQKLANKISFLSTMPLFTMPFITTDIVLLAREVFSLISLIVR